MDNEHNHALYGPTASPTMVRPCSASALCSALSCVHAGGSWSAIAAEARACLKAWKEACTDALAYLVVC